MVASTGQWPPEIHLTNQIHPIFAQRNFAFGIDYRLMKPALRLASRFIELNDMQPFLHMLLLGDVKRVEPSQAPETGQRIFVGQSYKGNLDSHEALRTRQALEELAKNVRFGKLEPTQATYLGETHNKRSKASGSFRGTKSDIMLLLSGLEDAHNDLLCLKHPERWLQRSFEIAVTLVHELCHAARNASQRRRTFDPHFLHGCLSSEEGCEGENILFGGRIYPLNEGWFPDRPAVFDTMDRRSVLEPWPSAGTIAISADDKFAPSIATRQGTPLSTIVFAIPNEFVAKLFQDAFWDEVVSTQGIKALHTVGKAYRMDLKSKALIALPEMPPPTASLCGLRQQTVNSWAQLAGLSNHSDEETCNDQIIEGGTERRRQL